MLIPAKYAILPLFSSLDNNGTFTLTFNDNQWNSTGIVNGVFTKSNLIKWITNASIDNAGNLKIEFNNGTSPLEKTLTWISAASYENGVLNITFNNNSINYYRLLC